MTDWTDTPRPFANPLVALKAFLRSKTTQIRHKRAMKSLADADDSTLRDLGITHEELTHAIGYARPPVSDADLIFLKGPRPRR
ncbi:MAG: hypothetical protein AAGF50_15450 [Pseudomonadota bacterium]